MPATKSLIQKVTLTSDAATVTLSSIPQTYTDLLVLFSARSTRVTTGAQSVNIRFNGSTTGYSGRRLYGEASSVGSDTAGLLGVAPQDGTTANCFSSNELYIPNYTSSINKSASLTGVVEANVTDGNAGIYAVAGLWSNTSAITSIEFSVGLGNLKSGSTFYLYGIQASPNTPILTQGTQTLTSTEVIISNYDSNLTYSITASAGTASRSGDTITVSGLSDPYDITVTVTASDASGYSSNSSIVSKTPISVQYLVIAGGGGGGTGRASFYQGPGGGAGGYRSSVVGELSGGGASAESQLSCSLNVPLFITVGAGGSGAPSGGTATNGANSIFSSIISLGGGSGGKFALTSGANPGATGGTGGSGGGSAVGFSGSVTGGLGTSGQGYNGGPTYGHGGGAGSAGGGNTTSPFGTAGSGRASSVTGVSVTRAAGGLTGDPNSGAASPAGAANTGNGGGGGSYSTTAANNGGSGVVILSIPIANTAIFSAGVTQTSTTSGGRRIYIITAAGATDTVTFS